MNFSKPDKGRIPEPPRNENMEELRKNRRKLDAAFRNAVHFQGFLTPGGILTDANETSLALIGAKPEDVLGRHFADTPWWRHNSVEREKLREAIERAADGETVQFRARHLNTSGETIYVQFSLRPLFDDSGDVEYLLAEGRDVTELEDLNAGLEEQVRRRTQELEDAYNWLVRNRMISGLAETAAKVAHEIKTPLGVAYTAFTHLLELVPGLKNDNHLNPVTEIVLENMERASRLVLSFQNLAAGQASEKRRVFNLANLLQEVRTAMGGDMQKYRQTIDIECPAHIEMESYLGSVTSIFTNLIENSRKHGYPDNSPGRISITASRIHDTVQIHYADDGKGMVTDEVDRIFEPFYTTRTDTGSAGLGMSLVFNHTAKVLGGTLNIDTAPGRGFGIRLRLPRIAPRQD